MNAGDSILVNVDPTLGNWRHGTFISQRRPINSVDDVYMVGIGEKDHIGYEEKEVYPHSVKRFIKLSEEAAKAKHDAELPMAFAMVQAALIELMPDVVAAIKDGSISAFNVGGVTLDPVVYETPRIGVVQETAGWQVTEWKYYHSTRNQPEEWVDAPVGEPTNYGQAVKRFIEAIFRLKANSYWEM